MTFKAGQSGNPGGRSREKPIRDALRMELAAAELDDYKPPRLNTIRGIARALIEKAQTGDAAAFEKIADRVEGKVPQGIVGDDEHDPVRLIQRIERIIVHPADSDSGGVHPATGTREV